MFNTVKARLHWLQELVVKHTFCKIKSSRQAELHVARLKRIVKSQSHFATDGVSQSVSQSVSLFFHGRPSYRVDGSVLQQATVLACITRFGHAYILICFFYTFFSIYIQDVYVHTRPVSPGFVQQIMPNT
jgi:hypothetical protein